MNYKPTTQGARSWREITSGGTRTKRVEYHCRMSAASGLTRADDLTVCTWRNEHNKPRYSGLQRSALTTTLPSAPIFCLVPSLTENWVSCRVFYACWQREHPQCFRAPDILPRLPDYLYVMNNPASHGDRIVQGAHCAAQLEHHWGLGILRFVLSCVGTDLATD
jgi:hypothetical protein